MKMRSVLVLFALVGAAPGFLPQSHAQAIQHAAHARISTTHISQGSIHIEAAHEHGARQPAARGG